MAHTTGITDSDGPCLLNPTGLHGPFLKLTCDMEHVDMARKNSDMTWATFLNSTCDMSSTFRGNMGHGGDV